jgi:hypothetical protein
VSRTLGADAGAVFANQSELGPETDAYSDWLGKVAPSRHAARTLPSMTQFAPRSAASAARQTYEAYETRANPASAHPASSASRPKPSTGPSAPVPCRPPRAAVCAPQARNPAVRS